LRQFLQALFRRLPSHWGLLQPPHAVCRPASTIVRSIRAGRGLAARAISARILPMLWSLDSKDWKRLTSRWLRLKSLAILGLLLFLARIELPFANYLAAALQHFRCKNDASEKTTQAFQLAVAWRYWSLSAVLFPIFHAVGALATHRL
jgi:hypothetical protein